jgi:hypothetical protein
VATFLIVITSQWRRRAHCKRQSLKIHDIEGPHSWYLKRHEDQNGADEKAEDDPYCDSKIAYKGFMQVCHSESEDKEESVKKE